MYLNINPGGALLREAQDIDEELRMMMRIYSQQLRAMEAFRKTLRRLYKQPTQANGDRVNIQIQAGSGHRLAPDPDLEFVDNVVEQIGNRKLEIEELALAAERTCTEVSYNRTSLITAWSPTGLYLIT